MRPEPRQDHLQLQLCTVLCLPLRFARAQVEGRVFLSMAPPQGLCQWQAGRQWEPPTQARLLPSVSKTKATVLAGGEKEEKEVQGAFWYQGRKSLWEEVVCRGDAFCSAGEMSCTVTPNHCHLRVIVMGTWEAGSHGKPYLGHCVPLTPSPEQSP